MIWRIIGNVVGLALLVVALPLTVSPIPLGLLLFFVAVVILVASNPYAAKLLTWARQRWSWVDGVFDKAQDVLPEELAEPLRETDTNGGADDSPPVPVPAPVASADAKDAETREMVRKDIPRLLR